MAWLKRNKVQEENPIRPQQLMDMEEVPRQLPPMPKSNYPVQEIAGRGRPPKVQQPKEDLEPSEELWALERVPTEFGLAIKNNSTGEKLDSLQALVRILNILEGGN